MLTRISFGTGLAALLLAVTACEGPYFQKARGTKGEDNPTTGATAAGAEIGAALYPKVQVAVADHRAQQKIREESQARYDTAIRLRKGSGGPAISEEETRTARVVWEKSTLEEAMKRESIGVAKLEANSAKTVVEMHEI